jgi:hypothetical protein
MSPRRNVGKEEVWPLGRGDAHSGAASRTSGILETTVRFSKTAVTTRISNPSLRRMSALRPLTGATTCQVPRSPASTTISFCVTRGDSEDSPCSKGRLSVPSKPMRSLGLSNNGARPCGSWPLKRTASSSFRETSTKAVPSNISTLGRDGKSRRTTAGVDGGADHLNEQC